MEKNEFNYNNNGMENNVQPVQNTENYTDISSGSEVYSTSEPKSRSDLENTAPIEYPQQPVYPTYSSPYNYERYTSQFSSQQNYTPSVVNVQKKSSKGKKAAFVAGTLALALCVGLGGGILGSYFMNQSSSSSAVKTYNGTSVSATTSDGTDSGLNIIQASNSGKTPTSIEEVVSNVKDSVVEITTEVTKYGSFYGQYVAQGAGSGVIISDDGYIVTNNHVIEDASSIKVTLTDGSTYDAKLIGTDANLDVALIKIEASNLTVAPFGDSDSLKVGETAIAIGNPLGQLGGTVTHGIISALDRSIQLDNNTMELLQTDAAINPGNSGGGLFDANGNLIGIVVAKSTSASDGTSLEGLGFAIPINNVKEILGDLKTKGYVSGKANLGVTVVDVLTENAKARYNVDREGVYIYSLTSGGAAEKAGLTVGDCIIKVGDKEIGSTSELSLAISKYKAGQTADIVVYRDGKEQTITVTFGESVPETVKNSNNFNPGSNSGNNDDYNNYNDWYDFFN